MLRGELIAGVVCLCLFLGAPACDTNNHGGGGGGDGSSSSTAISGPSSVGPLAAAVFTCAVDGSAVTAWRWSVKGLGAIVGSAEGSKVKIRATAGENGGAYKVYLKAQVGGAWTPPAEHKVRVSPYPQFQLVRGAPGAIANFWPFSITGSGTLLYFSGHDTWASWGLNFVGDTSGLPDMVQVTINVSDNGMTFLRWLTGDGKTATLAFPKAGGGTVGVSGTVLDVGADRPAVDDDGTHQGTIRFTAPGVKTMVITLDNGS